MTENMYVKKLLPLLFLALIAGFYLVALRAPYHFFQQAVEEGVESSFLSLRKLPDKFYSGQDYQFTKMIGITTDFKDLWENIHFNDFVIPFPIRHPTFLVAPKIDKEDGEYHFGYKVMDYKLYTINEVVFRKKERFSLNLYDHKIFHLPLFERKITSMGLNKVWKDVFEKDIFLSPYLKTPSYSELYNPAQIPLSEMVYELFILSVRERFFPIKMENMNWWNKRKLGIIELAPHQTIEGEEKEYLRELVYYLEGDQVYTIEIKTLKNDFAAEKYRQRLLETITYKMSEPDSSIPLYASFQNLSYELKLTPNGLTYLFAAFSHNKKDENFLRQAIRFMERGKNDKVYLDPLYKYGFELYGTNFSKMMKKIQETEQEKLKRKIEEEKALERAKLENTEILDEKESFESEQEKIKFYLQKAKDSNTLKKDDKSLILD